MNRRTFVHRTAGGVAAFGALRALAACRPDAPSPAQDAGFIAIRERYFLRTLELNPVTSTYLGGDGYAPELAAANGKLRDFGPAALQDEVAFLQAILKELDAIPPGSLTAQARIDRAVVQAQAGYMVHQLAERRYQERCVDTYVAEPFRGIDWQIQGMTDAGNGLLGTEAEWALVVARVGAVPAYVETAKANLAAGKAAGNLPDRRLVARDGLDGSRANVDYFTTTLPALAVQYIGDRPFAKATVSQLTSAGAAAGAAYASMAAFLPATYDLNETVDRYAAGEVEYAWRVNNCLKDARTPAELYAYGAAQVSEYEAKIFRVAEEVSTQASLGLPFGTDADRRRSVRAVMDHLAKDSPKDDTELFAWYREAGTRAVAYGRQQQMFDIPADYQLVVTETPPVLRSSTDASYYPAPPFKTTGVGRFYLTPTGNDPGALKLNNRSSVATTAIHEGFPGHDWDYKYMTQHAAEISDIRWLTPGAVEDSFSMWEDSMSSEGWALYSEELMAEASAGRPYGFYEPGEYLYMLQAQLMRAVRVRVDVGIHTGRMTFDEAVDYFAAHVDFFPDARTAQASDPVAKAAFDTANRAIYRYSKWPTQCITYNLGKHNIQDLRAATEQQQGTAFSLKAFHERFMGMGTIPTGYFREDFLKG
ncbi:MAG TPA: DUF885 domain-containing protein [Gemmatimonadales bacterium]|nr:DUF885 domain-containing protein [Gemmatimonadales bacterium]